jgi:hypothetical protein
MGLQDRLDAHGADSRSSAVRVERDDLFIGDRPLRLP